MNQKEFELIAEVFRWGLSMPNYTYEELEPIRDLLGLFVEHLDETYSKFDREKFMEAIGVKS